MAHGHEDWGINTEATAIVSTDNNELAVRLGSEFRISQTGHVFYATTFVNDLNIWRTTRSGTKIGVSVDKRKGVLSRGSLKVSNVIAADRNVTLVKRFPLLSSNKWGLETVVWVDTNNAQFRARLIIGDGTNDREFSYQIDANADTISLLDSDGAYDTIKALTITPIATSDAWLYTKMVINADDYTYDKLIINNEEFSTISQLPDVNAVAGLPHLTLVLYVDNTGATVYTFRIGSCILSIDEP